MDANDAISFLMAGASAVQVGSATFVDPYAIPKIIEGIGEYADKSGCRRLRDMIGITHE